MTQAHHKTRRRHSAELKQQILAECAQPGASVASVALSHGINANVVHKWRRQIHGSSLDLQVPSFVPVALPAPSCAAAPDIRIELRRGATSVSLTWPVCAAEHCAAWMRELLK
jgi:transposase